MITFISGATVRESISSTRVCHFFSWLTLGELEDMFSAFAIEQLVVDRRLLVNRQNHKKMYRVWFQGRFRKPKEGEDVTGIEKERGVRDIDESIE